MTHNLGTADRAARVVGAMVLFVVGVVSPLPWLAQVGLGLAGIYMLGSSLVGTCLGYRLMGMSTCPVQKR